MDTLQLSRTPPSLDTGCFIAYSPRKKRLVSEPISDVDGRRVLLFVTPHYASRYAATLEALDGATQTWPSLGL